MCALRWIGSVRPWQTESRMPRVHAQELPQEDERVSGTTWEQGGTRPGFVTSPGIYRELIGLEQFGRRGPDGDVRFSRNRLFFQRGR